MVPPLLFQIARVPSHLTTVPVGKAGPSMRSSDCPKYTRRQETLSGSFLSQGDTAWFLVHDRNLKTNKQTNEQTTF